MFKCYVCNNEVIMVVEVPQHGRQDNVTNVKLCSDCFSKFEKITKAKREKEHIIQ